MKTMKTPWAITLAALLLAGCESNNLKIGQHAVPAPDYVAAQQQLPPTLQDAQGKPVEGGRLVYQLQPGDQVDVKLYYHPELNEQLMIGPDNLIALQLVGEVNVSGMSPRQLADELTARYGRTLRNPQSTVILRKYALPRIFVAGEVGNPTAHLLDTGRLTAFQAITLSGGFRKGAERSNVIVLRNSGTGKPEFIKVDLQGHLEQTVNADILLRPYDIVYVPQRRIAEVAEFFDEYVNKIVPIYRNLGFSFSYNLRNEVQVETR